jgi:hypothetical protein
MRYDKRVGEILMQGDKLGEFTGKVTTRRVLPSTNGGPKMETSHELGGKLLGVNIREIATYSPVARPDGTLIGEGQGITMGEDGSSATWVGQGMGIIGSGGTVSFRGAVFYSSSSPKWASLNKCAAIFEYEVDGEGNAKSTLWEWK